MENWRTTNDDIGYCTSLAALHWQVTFPRDRCFQGYPTCTFDEKLAGQALSGDRISCLEKTQGGPKNQYYLARRKESFMIQRTLCLLPRQFSSKTGAMGMLWRPDEC